MFLSDYTQDALRRLTFKNPTSGREYILELTPAVNGEAKAKVSEIVPQSAPNLSALGFTHESKALLLSTSAVLGGVNASPTELAIRECWRDAQSDDAPALLSAVLP